MVTAVYLSSKDDSTVASELNTPSFMAMIQANTNKKVQDKDFILQTKTQLINEINQGLKTGNLNAGGNSFDHIVFDFSANEDAQVIANEIVSFYSKPDYTVVKNQGGGRVQNKTVKGTREVLYDLHIAQDGTAHLHILKSHFSIDNKIINPATTCKDTYVIKAEQYNLNEHLENIFGTSNVVSSFLSGGSPNSTLSNPKASPQTKNIVNEAVKADTIQQFQDILATAQNASVSQNILSNTIQGIDKELAELKEKTNVLFEMRKLAEGIKAVESNNEILERNNKVLTEKLTAITEEKENILLEKTIIETTLDEKLEDFIVKETTLNSHIITLQEEVKEKEFTVKELEDINFDVEKQLVDTSKLVEELSESNKDKDRQIKIQVSQFESLEKALDIISKKQADLVIDNAKLQRELLEQKDFFDKKLEDQQKEYTYTINDNKAQSEMRLKALEDDNKKLKEQNEIIVKENTIFKELAEMAIVKYKQATAILKDLSSKITNVTDKKTITNVLKQSSEYDKAVKQVDLQSKDINEKMAAVKALFAKGKAKTDEVTDKANETKNKTKPK